MESKLYLETEYKYGRTNISDVFFTAPNKVASPFYEKDRATIMLMSASAGLLAGDMMETKYQFKENSKATIISQSYEKVFNTEENKASKLVDIKVDANAEVTYIPYPVIPFAGSTYESEAIVNLDESATFMYGDIFTCGRTGMDEYFLMRSFSSKLKVYVGNRLAFYDYTLIEPSKFAYKTLGMWNNYTHNGMLYMYVPKKEKEEEIIAQIRAIANKESEQIYVGVSKCLRGVVIRILGFSGDVIYEFFKKVVNMNERG